MFKDRMSADIDKFSETLKRLRYLHDAPDLDKKIAAYEPTAKKSDRFIIKMELKRLAQPVSRIIDLRHIVKSDCSEFIKNNVTHYLDKIGVDDFTSEMERYKNVYCVGVFDYVMEKAKERDEDDLEKGIIDNLPPPKNLSLTGFFQRQEERLYLSSQLHLYKESPSNLTPSEQKEMRQEVKTTDVSESGLSVKIAAAKFVQADLYWIKFAELEREYSFSKSMFVQYRRVRHKIRQGFVYLTLIIDESQDSQVINACQELLRKCIATQKRRNRIAVDNTVEAVEVKLHEQFVVSKLNRLPVFIQVKNGQYNVESCLECTENLPIRKFLQLSKTQSIVGHLFDTKTVVSALTAESGAADFFVMRFRDKNKALCVAVMPLEDALQSPAVKPLIEKGIQQGSAKLIRIYHCRIDVASSCHVPSSLPDSAGEVFENMNRKPHQALLDKLAPINCMCVLADITSTLLVTSKIENYEVNEQSKLTIRNSMLNLSKGVGTYFKCEVETADSRHEERFVLKMPITIRGKGQIKDKQKSGVTTNVSTRGMSVLFDSKHSFIQDDEVYVDFSLPNQQGQKDFIGLRYKVVDKGEKNLHLALAGDIAIHEGRIALRDLLYSNLSKLRIAGSNDPTYGYSRAIRNLFASNHINLCALTAKTAGEHYVHALVSSPNTTDIVFHDSLTSKDSLTLLCKNLEFRKALFTQVLSLTKEQPSATLHLLVVARKKRKASPLALVVKQLKDKKNADEFNFVYKNIQNFGEPFLLRLSISSKGLVFDKYVRDELRYLSRFANAKHEQIMTLLKNTTSIVEFQDVSELV